MFLGHRCSLCCSRLHSPQLAAPVAQCTMVSVFAPAACTWPRARFPGRAFQAHRAVCIIIPETLRASPIALLAFQCTNCAEDGGVGSRSLSVTPRLFLTASAISCRPLVRLFSTHSTTFPSAPTSVALHPWPTVPAYEHCVSMTVSMPPPTGMPPTTLAPCADTLCSQVLLTSVPPDVHSSLALTAPYTPPTSLSRITLCCSNHCWVARCAPNVAPFSTTTPPSNLRPHDYETKICASSNLAVSPRPSSTHLRQASVMGAHLSTISTVRPLL